MKQAGQSFDERTNSQMAVSYLKELLGDVLLQKPTLIGNSTCIVDIPRVSFRGPQLAPPYFRTGSEVFQAGSETITRRIPNGSCTRTSQSTWRKLKALRMSVCPFGEGIGVPLLQTKTHPPIHQHLAVQTLGATLTAWPW